jgi:hypothetical protein
MWGAPFAEVVLEGDVLELTVNDRRRCERGSGFLHSADHVSL